MKIFDINQIQQTLDLNKDLNALIKNQQQAFIDFSAKRYEVPLPTQLIFPAYLGECHIKAGFKKDSETFIIKVASGFCNNPVMGLSSNEGMILVFSQKTGLLSSILYDRGWLTTLRTAIAAIVVAEITPWDIGNIGIIGTGALASLIQTIIKKRFSRANVLLWGRDLTKTLAIRNTDTQVPASLQELLMLSDLVISTTASTQSFIKYSDMWDKKHVIALGADDVHKQEYDIEIFKRADKIIVDSKTQSCKFGDSFHAIQKGVITVDDTIELGEILQSATSLKSTKLIITDLTGIAAQDAAIADFIIQKLTLQYT